MTTKKNKLTIINLKILAVILCAVIVSVLACGYILTSYAMHLLEKQEIENASENIRDISESIERYAADIKDFTGNITMNSSFQLMLRKKDLLEGVEYFKNRRDIQQNLKYYEALRSSLIDDIYIIDNKNEIIGDMTKDYSKDLEWYESFLEQGAANGFSTVQTGENDSRYLYFVMNILDVNNIQNSLGRIVVVLDYDVFVKETLRQTEQFRLVMLNKEQKIITSILGEEESAEEFCAQCLAHAGASGTVAAVGNQYYFHEQIEGQDWNLYGTLEKGEITGILRPVRQVFVMVIVLCLLVSLLAVVPIVQRLTSPIEQIIQAMRRISAGDMDIQLQINTKDEWKLTSDVFNQMTRDIKQYTADAVEQEKQENELKMKLFMAQINPHFICNTLNAIIYQAQKIKAYDIVSVTRAFINIIQVTINLDTTSIAMVKDEKKYIEDYMVITRFRYQDIADLEWDIEEEVEQCRMNRMLLYPIVENSILHGIFPTGEKGTIRISVRRERDKLLFEVSDDGQGMNEAELRALRERIVKTKLEGRKSIGLQNVNQRLLTLYGPDCQMTIESPGGKGCITRFSIPA